MLRPLGWTALAIGFLAGTVPGTSPGQDAPLARHHPWGSFSPGAWKVVRLVTETLDEKGVVTGASAMETTTTLNSCDQGGVSLLVEAVVEVADKRLKTEPRCVRQDFFGLTAGANTRVKAVQATHLVIEGRKMPVRVHEAEEVSDSGRTVTKVYCSDNVAPYVLRRETITTDAEGKTRLSETTASVVALDLPWQVLSEVKTTALVHSVQKQAKGTVETWAVTSPEVPGGVVCHASKEFDENGRLVRRSSLELIDYALEPEDDQGRGLFPRLRASRARKAHRN